VAATGKRLTRNCKSGCLRRYGIMSGLAVASHELVAYRGGDALSVCLNTVALIFIIECDDLLYENAVGEDSLSLESFLSPAYKPNLREKWFGP
jgi:hypothetical protein